MNTTSVITKLAIQQWEQQVERATKLLDEMSDEVLARHIAPGKNTGTYIVGHLIAVHDAIPVILGLGEKKYPELYDTYITQPDGKGDAAMSLQGLRTLWKETHDRVTGLMRNVPEEDWFKRHESMTDADFEVNPLRNKLSVLLSRTSHLAYHLGQLRLLM